MHALGPHQQSRIRLELPVRRERHPKCIEIAVQESRVDLGVHGGILEF
jgi:hypothetical protein